MRKLVGITLALTLALVACGSADPAVEATDSAAPSSRSPSKVTVGRMETTSPTVTVAGRELFDGDALSANDLLVTSDLGLGSFSLRAGIRLCNLGGDTLVRIRPSRDVLVRVERSPAGVPVACVTTDDAGLKTLQVGDAMVESQDPVFSLQWHQETPSVKVWRGFVSVWSLTAGDRDQLLLGPGLESFIGTGGPQGAGPFDQDGPDTPTFRRLARLLPPTDLSRPEARGSSALASAYDRQELRIGVDVGRDPSGRVEDFVSAFAGRVSQSWNMSVDTDQVFVTQEEPPPDESTPPDSEDQDLIVSPVVEEGAASIPFVKDDDGVVWRLSAPNDENFARAFGGWFGRFLAGDAYRALYVDDFQSILDYEPFRDLVAPS